MTPMEAERCDLLIVGAGPAGLAAAAAAAPGGQRIVLIDDNPAPGGQIWRDGPGARLPASARTLRAAVGRCANVALWTGTRVLAATASDELLLEQPHRSVRLRWGRLILCTGARELLLPFPGWTLPGVSGAGGLQALIKAGWPVAGERVVVAGSGPLLLAAASTAAQAGAKVVGLIEQAPAWPLARLALSLVRWPEKLVQAATLLPRHYRSGAVVTAALGAQRVEAVQVRQGVQPQAPTLTLDCDRLACGYGLVPNIQLGQLLGCALDPGTGHGPALRVDALQATSLAAVWAAGECTGVGGSELARVEGTIAGLAASGQIDAARPWRRRRERWQAFAARIEQTFALGPAVAGLPQPDTLVCRCEDVAWRELQPHDGWTEAKLQTRCGMGACQGRVCGAALQVLKGWSPPAPRVPLVPAPIGSLAGAGWDNALPGDPGCGSGSAAIDQGPPT